jgi:hypothetical protein
MRLTIENTRQNPDTETITKVIIEHPSDALNFSELVEMFRAAAMGIGFAEETVNRLDELTPGDALATKFDHEID